MSVFSFVKAGKKAFDTIKSVKPFVPKNKKEILERDLRRARAKRKTSEVNLALSLPETPVAVPLLLANIAAPPNAARVANIFLFRFLDFLLIIFYRHF